MEVKLGYNEFATSVELLDGDGSKLPDPATESSYNLVWFNYSDYKNPADDPHREIVRVMSLTGNFLSVQRGQEGILASTKNAPAKVYKMLLTLTRAAYEEIINGKHGLITGDTFGDARGTDATDFQFLRSEKSQVASGASSFIASGINNKASGYCSFATGSGNTASGQYALSEGRLSSSTGTASHAEGYQNISGGVAAHAEGQSCQASGNSAHAEGYHTSALGANSHSEGNGAVSRLKGEHARASGYISEYGDAQYSSVTLSGVTLDGNPSEIFLSPPSERIVLEDDTAAGFWARITAHSSTSSAEAAFIEIKGFVSRLSGAASVQLSPCIKTVIWKSSALWDANFEADTINGALRLRVTGEAGKTVRWLAVVGMGKLR
ncbi:MAG: hypothetical protein ACM3P0_15195 [Acidobacteriota bacterium]